MPRPKKENPRTRFVNIRLTNDEHDILQHLADKLGLSCSDVIRQALKVYFRISKTEIEDEFS